MFDRDPTIFSGDEPPEDVLTTMIEEQAWTDALVAPPVLVYRIEKGMATVLRGGDLPIYKTDVPSEATTPA